MSLNNLARENDELKRKLSGMQNKAALLSQEIERLTSKINELQLNNTHYQQ